MTEDMQETISELLTGPPRLCTLAADQQSCGPAGTAFMNSMNVALGVDLLFDPPHRMWNSEKLGLLYGGGWESILMTSIVYAVNDGPWQGGAFLSQLVDAKNDYMAMTNKDECQLFLRLLPRIARERGKPESANGPSYAA